MEPLTGESGRIHWFVIKESIVLTSKCSSAPQAAIIPSVIMAENGIEGIKSTEHDGWMEGG